MKCISIGTEFHFMTVDERRSSKYRWLYVMLIELQTFTGVAKIYHIRSPYRSPGL